MARRWIRLDCDWEESAWLDALPGQAAGCWPRLLCHVKLRGKGGRCKAPDPSVLARRWRVPRQAVDELIAAAKQDEAIKIKGDELQVMNWPRYQEPDPTAAARKRRQREREESSSHGTSRQSRRDTCDTGRDPSRDHRQGPPTETDSPSLRSGENARRREGVGLEGLDDYTRKCIRGLYGGEGITGTDERIWNGKNGPEERERLLTSAALRWQAEGHERFNSRFFRKILEAVIANEGVSTDLSHWED